MLIVSEDYELIHRLEEYFSAFYQIQTVSGGKEGFDQAVECMPDLILSDMDMSDMSGIELCQKIRSCTDLCHIPVLLLVSCYSVEQHINALLQGADDYMVSSVNIRLLHAKLKNLIQNRQYVYYAAANGCKIKGYHSNPPSVDTDIDMLEKMSEIIEGHLDDPNFDIPELCKEIGIGRSMLYLKLKSCIGMTPNNYILTCRLKYAATLLKCNRSMTVGEIGDKCGFSSPAYFGRCFKHQYGVTPQGYRKSQL